MATALLTSAEYPAIRAALDVSLTAADLPDSIIARPIFSGAGEAEVLSRDPGALDRTGAALQRVTNAAVFFTAALLLPALPQIVTETHGDQVYRRQEIDVDARVAELRARGAAEVAAVLPVATPTTRATPPFFGLARGGRGR